MINYAVYCCDALRESFGSRELAENYVETVVDQCMQALSILSTHGIKVVTCSVDTDPWDEVEAVVRTNYKIEEVNL